jgi:hypothetical protein
MVEMPSRWSTLRSTREVVGAALDPDTGVRGFEQVHDIVA